MGKDTTTRIKGVAILVMIMHHFLARNFFPDLPDAALLIGAGCKICVAIYAVLSGYGYFFARTKTLRYGLKKAWGLLQIYWVSLFTLFIPLAVRGGFSITPQSFFINLFGLLPNLNWYAWYVFFYIFCMLVMPFVYRAFRFRPWVNLAMALLVPYAIELALHSVPNYKSITAVHDLFSCFLYFPCFLVGYLMAKYDVVSRVRTKVGGRTWVPVAGCALAFACRCVVASVFGLLLDAFYAPAIVCMLACLFERGKKAGLEDDISDKGSLRHGGEILGGLFFVLGKYSTGMWFFHAAFFSTYVCDVFQPVLLLVTFPPLMYVWLVLLSLFGAVFYKKLLDALRWACSWVSYRLCEI